jgi:hypothetical protein
MMVNSIRGSLSDLASLHDNEDEKAQEDEEYAALGKRSDDDEPGWVLGIITIMVQHLMESFL